MEELKLLKRKVEWLEKRLDRAEAHGRALERVVKHIVGDASQRAFEFAVEQYEMNERAMREAFRGGQEPADEASSNGILR